MFEGASSRTGFKDSADTESSCRVNSVSMPTETIHRDVTENNQNGVVSETVSAVSTSIGRDGTISREISAEMARQISKGQI